MTNPLQNRHRDATTAVVPFLPAVTLAGRIALAATVLLAATMPARAEETEPSPIDTLFTGSPSERLAAVEKPYALLLAASGSPDEDDVSSGDDPVDTLITYLGFEHDEWISRRLLESLDGLYAPAIDRLFRAALDSGSVNLASRAVLRLAATEDPDSTPLLEALWKDGVPDWLEPDLIAALANQHSRCCIADFMRLARDDDHALRLAAIEALGTLADPEAIPVLARATRDGRPADRAAAIQALAAWPDSDEAFGAVLSAGRASEPALRSAAVDALGRMHRPEGDALLIDILDAPPGDPDLRPQAAEALEGSDHPDASPALVRLLHRLHPWQDVWLAHNILRVLHNRDDVAALTWLQDLDPTIAGTLAGELPDLIDYLGRDRSDSAATIVVTTSCMLSLSSAPDDEDAWHVVPPGRLGSIRCWEAPDIAGDPEIDERIPAGTTVSIEDHFERPGVSWVEVNGTDAAWCWVPLDFLAPGPGTPATPPRPGSALRHEADIASGEVDRLPVLAAIEAGLIEVIEPDDTGAGVTGVAIIIDPADARRLALLKSILGCRQPTLSEAVSWMLDALDDAAWAENLLDGVDLDDCDDDPSATPND
jgi:HEAT repeat protein